MEDPQYEILKHLLACENSHFSVFLDTIGMDGKTLVKNYMSITPKNRNYGQITGVITLPVHNGQFGLLKIYRPPIREFSWELPGGFVEPNETPIESAKRELEEETGLICGTKDLIHLGDFDPSPGILAAKTCIYSAEKCKPAPKIEKPEFGISNFKWFDMEEIEQFIEKGELKDMSTVFAILRRANRINKTL